MEKKEIKKLTDSIIRVNHAGEYGAEKIYRGQKAILKNLPLEKEINKMLEEERKHLKKFNDLVVKRNVRPTLLMPLWNIGGYSMGIVTAVLGKKSTMTCTEAVEEVICEHYKNQEKILKNIDKELYAIVKKFHKDEEKHKIKAKELGSGENLGHKILKKSIKGITKIAIKLSEKI